jgi:repressor LexA
MPPHSFLLAKTKSITMNVKVEIELCITPSKQDHDEMYNAAEFLTNDTNSILVYQSKDHKNALVAEFTINRARQIDVVDMIGNEFSYNVENYSQSSISFPKTHTRKTSKRRQSKFTLKQGQYLAFIYYFSKVNGVSPNENDFKKYFNSSLSAVRRMILNLENRKLILHRNNPFCIKLCLNRSEIPDLK